MSGSALTAVALGEPAPRPRFRTVPLPPVEPPYDDEVPMEQGDADLSGCVVLLLPGMTDIGRGSRRPLPPRRGTPLPVLAPAPGPWAVRFVRVVLEVVSGDRPPGQLTGWTTPEIASRLARRAARMRRGGERPATSIRSVRVGQPRPGAAEVCVVIGWDERIRAIALRMEAQDHGWRCCAFELG